MSDLDFLLEKSRTYEMENACKADCFRPEFHVTGGIGWINNMRIRKRTLD